MVDFRGTAGAPRRGVSVWTLLLPAVGLIAGLLFSASSGVSRGTDLRSSATDLPGVIRAGLSTNQQNTAELADLTAQVDRMTAEAAPGSAALATLNDRIEPVAQDVGMLPVAGPAVRVTLNDSALRGVQIPEGISADDIVVHQQDVQGVVNALWAGGAEAMMIMDQRVIATSAVRCVGNTLSLQGRVYSPPYVITAIGPAEAMLSSLQADPTVAIYREYVDAVGLGYEVATLAEAQFPAFDGAVSLQHATQAR